MARATEALLELLKHDLQTHVEFKNKFMPKEVKAAKAEGMRFIDYHDLVLTLGEGFLGQERPDWLERMEPQHCYDNTRELVWDAENLVYYEGYAMKDGLIIPVAHAWAVDEVTGAVIDATWENPEDAVYWGIPIDMNVLVQCWDKSGYNAALESDWMANNWFLREGWKQLTRAGILELT